MHLHNRVNPEKIKFANELRRNMTQSEKKLWSHLKWYWIAGYRFKAQEPLFGYIVDFYCPKRRLIVEVDGLYHEDEKIKKYDQLRDDRLKDYAILRVHNKTVDKWLYLALFRIWFKLLAA